MIDTLLIGGKGQIGSGLRIWLPRLDPDYETTSVDLPGAPDKAREASAQSNFVEMDVCADPDGLRRLLEGRDLVVYLARTSPLQAMNSMTDLVFESVRDICPRALLIGSSSVHAVDRAYWPFDREPYATLAARRFDELESPPEPIPARMEACPASDYGEEKAYVERWAERFAAEGLAAVATRWGGVNVHNRNVGEIAYFTVWCHQEDAARMVDSCCKAHRDGRLRSGAHYFVISDNRHNIFDIETPRREVGYAPVHDSEVFFG